MAKSKDRTKAGLSKFKRKDRQSKATTVVDLVGAQIERLRQLGFLVSIQQLEEDKWLVKTVLASDPSNIMYGFGLAHNIYDAFDKAYLSSTKHPDVTGSERALMNTKLYAEEDFRLFGPSLRPRLDKKAKRRMKEIMEGR